MVLAVAGKAPWGMVLVVWVVFCWFWWLRPLLVRPHGALRPSDSDGF